MSNVPLAANSLIISGIPVTVSGNNLFVNALPLVQASSTGVFLTGVANLGAGSGIFSSIANNAGQLRSLVTGSGMIILGDANTLTLHTTHGIQFNSGLQANINILTANTYSGILSGDIGPGTWLVSAALLARGTGNASIRMTAKVWSGIGAFLSSECSTAALGVNVTGFVNLDLGGIITTTAASTPLVLSAAVVSPTGVVLGAPIDNAVGIPTGTATYIQAVRLV